MVDNECLDLRHIRVKINNNKSAPSQWKIQDPLLCPPTGLWGADTLGCFQTGSISQGQATSLGIGRRNALLAWTSEGQTVIFWKGTPFKKLAFITRLKNFWSLLSLLYDTQVCWSFLLFFFSDSCPPIPPSLPNNSLCPRLSGLLIQLWRCFEHWRIHPAHTYRGLILAQALYQVLKKTVTDMFSTFMEDTKEERRDLRRLACHRSPQRKNEIYMWRVGNLLQKWHINWDLKDRKELTR